MGRIPSTIPSKSVVKRGLKHIRPMHREIARMLVTGKRQCAIARELGINQSRLSLVVNSPIFQEELNNLRGERDKTILNILSNR